MTMLPSDILCDKGCAQRTNYLWFGRDVEAFPTNLFQCSDNRAVLRDSARHSHVIPDANPLSQRTDSL